MSYSLFAPRSYLLLILPRSPVRVFFRTRSISFQLDPLYHPLARLLLTCCRLVSVFDIFSFFLSLLRRWHWGNNQITTERKWRFRAGYKHHAHTVQHSVRNGDGTYKHGQLFAWHENAIRVCCVNDRHTRNVTLDRWLTLTRELRQRGDPYRLDHHLQMRLIFGHLEQGGGYLGVPFRYHLGHDALQKGAVLVEVVAACWLVTGRRRRARRRRRLHPLAPLSHSLLARPYNTQRSSQY